ncbi:MAG: prolyl oligopeptidase family serine peptidase, partial [Planctomycetaceae bacterium]|nr:prolyl oligopeptidase family serine peptidase [Planctomycetaceae bacterium]
ESKYPKPWPAVLVVCGHSSNGKAYDGYQRACGLLALNGVLALIIDPVCQGERYQLAQPDGKPTIAGSTTGHSLIGLGSTLLGRNTARFEIRDGMRAIDYLQSRDDVDPKRIGCTGNSGGGTQTAYLMAIDQRIRCAAPSCYITSLQRLMETIGPQDAEQNIFGQLAFGMDHADYLLMRAPQPTLICCATQDYFDIGGAWNTFRYAKRLYSRMGYPAQVNLVENDDTHGFKKPLREAAVQWMVRWLRGEDRVIREPEMEVLTDQEAWCTPLGQVVLLAGERSVFDINAGYNRELASQREKLWAEGPTAELRIRIRNVIGTRTADELPEPKVETTDEAEHDGLRLTKIVLRPAEGIVLPGLLVEPGEQKKANAGPVLYLAADGAASTVGENGAVRQLVEQGHTVLALDVRGVGETAPEGKPWNSGQFGGGTKQQMLAYLLGHSMVGERTGDILTAAAWLRQHTKSQRSGVRVVATDHLCTPALHAAFLEPELIGSAKLVRPLVSWTSIIETPVTKHQLPNMVHGALKVYDLPQLVKSLGKKVTIEEPRDAAGEPVTAVE